MGQGQREPRTMDNAPEAHELSESKTMELVASLAQEQKLAIYEAPRGEYVNPYYSYTTKVNSVFVNIRPCQDSVVRRLS